LFQIGTRSVHPDGHIEVDGAFYSVPHTLVGEQVRAQWDGHLVRVYALATDGERRLVAFHLRVQPGSYSTKPEHRPLHRPARQAAYEAILLGKAEHIGPQALAWAQAVIEERGVRAYRLLQGLISLTAVIRASVWIGPAARRCSTACSAIAPCADSSSRPPNGQWFHTCCRSTPSSATCASTPRSLESASPTKKDTSPTMTTTTTKTTMPTTTMNTLAPATHELERQLRTLSLSGMAQTLLARNQEAISHHLAYTEFLELPVSDEFARRRDRLFTRRLKAARVPQLKTLESFDWSFNPQIPKALILDLGTVRFIREHGGLLLLGPPGTGKSHIALSLTVAAMSGFFKSTRRGLGPGAERTKAGRVPGRSTDPATRSRSLTAPTRSLVNAFRWSTGSAPAGAIMCSCNCRAGCGVRFLWLQLRWQKRARW
jgi:hypothetical protein